MKNLGVQINRIVVLKIAFLLVIFGFIFFQSSIPIIEIDDAYISFRVSRNFAHGKGIIFNVGESVEVYSNFLWVILLSFALRIGFGIPLFAKWAGVVFTLLSIFFCILILRRNNNKSITYFWGEVFVLSVLILSFPSILYWASGTLETPLFTFSLVFAVWAVTLKTENLTISLIKGIAMALPSLVRFDGIIFSAILIFYLLLNYKRIPFFRCIMLQILICIVLVGSYHIWRVSYYDSFLPNTVIVKGSTGFWRLLRGGLSYMVEFITVNNIPLFFIPALFVWRLRLGFSREEQLFILFILVYGGFIVRVRGDCMVGHRYATTLTPLIVLLGILTTRTLLTRFSGHVASKFHAPILAMALVLASVQLLSYYSRDFHKRYKWLYSQDYRAIAAYLVEKNLGNKSLVVSEPGIPGYFFPGRIIDSWGLTDRTIALIKKKHKIPITSIAFGLNAVPQYRGNANEEIVEYVLSQHPTAIYGPPNGFDKYRLEKLGYRKVMLGTRFPLFVNFSRSIK